jgi:DNA polymerase III sliding clamp (beta) subunit (PCNA family)
MKFSRAELLIILKKVSETIANSKLVPLYQCFCFKDNRVSSFNGSAGIVADLNFDGADFAVEGNRFYKIIQAMSTDIELNPKNERIYIKSGGNETWLNTHPTRAFPDILPQETELYCSAENFVKCLKDVQFTICNNSMKPSLLGVACCGSYLYSSDGVRITRSKLSKPVRKAVTLPTHAVDEMIKLGQPSEIFIGNNVVGGKWVENNLVYTTQTLAYSFPVNAVEEMIKSLDGVFVTMPDDLSGAVARVKLLAPVEETEIRIESTGKRLIVSAISNEVGAARETIDWQCEHKFNFNIKPFYIEQGLSKSLNVDISDILTGRKALLRFSGEGFEHMSGLMMSYGE